MNKSGLSPIEQSVAHHLEEVFPGRDIVQLVVGVSGGADSMALLHILHKLEVQLCIVHVNYQKRGRDSDQDARLVQQVADKLSADIETVTVDPEEAGNENFQQWARDVRYKAFRLKAEQTGVDGIATAHHQDDQIETILQKLFRGSGMASWSSMQVWNGHLFRPLLHTSRAEIENYCREKDIPFRTDATNLNTDYARNFLRHDWLPEIREHFPGWRTNVLRIGEQGRVFETALEYILSDVGDAKGRLRREKFLEMDSSLQKSVVLHTVRRVDPDQEISRDALNELSKLADLQTGKAIQLTETLELMRDRDFFKIVVDTGDSGFYIQLEKEEMEEQGASFNGLAFAVESFGDPDFKNKLYLDVEALQWPLTLRSWQSGDRFQPFGMDGHQSVADHLTNRKVAAAQKQSAIVLESFEETICAVIFPPIENRVPPGTISEVAKCGSSTRRCLTIKRIL